MLRNSGAVPTESISASASTRGAATAYVAREDEEGEEGLHVV
jgi:hypothetical protein